VDNWEPALVDDLAEDRGVILVDNSGVGESNGRTLSTADWPRGRRLDSVF
jgi:hypothetical protein